MAALAGIAVGQQWRFAYLFGVVPALLIVWVRANVREPEKWQAAAMEALESTEKRSQLGSFKNLLLESPWNRRALLGLLLAAVGLGTFWTVAVAGQGLAKEMLIRSGASESVAEAKSKFAYGIVQTTGNGLGLLAFGPISAYFGRRPTFVAFQLLAALIVPITCYVPQTYPQLLALLPLFGFLAVGIHAGYAIYFPELFPTHLRATGTSFCFNGGRLLAAAILWWVPGWLAGMSSHASLSVLGGLFLFGAALMAFLPETNRMELPE
jgi:MFS family permease